MSVEEAERAASSVEGFVSNAEGRLLYELARAANGSIVEIGSWKGRSTVWLAYGARDGNGGMVYAIDPHAGSQDHAEKEESSTLNEFMSNIQKAGVEATVVPMVMNAEEARERVPCPVGLLFLDGPSEGTQVREEVDRWLSCQNDGSLIAIHDTVSIPGPREVAEHLYLSSRYSDVGLVDTITYAKAIKDVTVGKKLLDLSSLLVRRSVIILGRFNYPEPIRAIGRRALRKVTR